MAVSRDDFLIDAEPFLLQLSPQLTLGQGRHRVSEFLQLLRSGQRLLKKEGFFIPFANGQIAFLGEPFGLIAFP